MIKKYYSILVLLLVGVSINAQVSSGSFGSTYVPASGFISIFGNHSFDYADCGLFPGLIVTERTDGVGYVNFTEGATWADASEESHIDGYARTFSTGPFAFPVGNDGKLGLLGISGSEDAAATYLFEDPALITGQLTITNPDLDAVSTREYWRLVGSNETVVTMTWDQLSNIEDLVNGDINKLTIIAWNGVDWEVIPTSINDYTLQSNSSNQFNEDITTSFIIGSMSTMSPIIPDDYDLISLGSLATPRTSLVEDGGLSVFPNPARHGAKTYVSYDLVGKRGKLEIYDGFQKLVYSQFLNRPSGNVLLPDLNLLDDRYVITLIEEDGSKKSKYLIVIK